MKKILSVAILILTIVCSNITASAASTVSFALSDCECQKNRLFNVEITATGNMPITAAIFEFTYDRSIIEYRGIKTNDSSMVSANDKGDCIKAVYLCADGWVIENGSTIFTLEFISLKEGVTDIDFTVYDCTDTDVNFMNIGNCSSGKVTVIQKASDTSGAQGKSPNSSEKSESQKATSAKTNQSSSENGDTNEDTKELNHFEKVNDIIQRDYNFVMPIILLCLSAVAGAVSIFYFIPKIKERKNKKEEHEHDDL